MNLVNEFVTAWWPVVAGIWTLLSGVIGLYARAISRQLGELKVDIASAATQVDAIEKELNAYKLEVAKTYMPSTDIKELVGDLKAFLIRIEDKVDGRKAQ